MIAIYARENGQGMAFPVPAEAPAGAPARSPGELTGLRLASMDEAPAPNAAVPVVDEEPPEPPAPGSPRPSLKRVK